CFQQKITPQVEIPTLRGEFFYSIILTGSGFLIFGKIFWLGTVDSGCVLLVPSYLDRNVMTSFTICVGVDAPAVTATVSIPSNHSSLSSDSDEILYAFVCAISFETCASLFELLLLGSPTTIRSSASFACSATAS